MGFIIENNVLIKYKQEFGVTDVVVPDTVTSIANDAFIWCKKLTGITIPDSVTSIGNYAFLGCKNLESITLPSGITSIGKGAFDRCHQLTSIEIPYGVVSIEEFAFCECFNLENIYIPETVTYIGKHALNSTKWYNNNIKNCMTAGDNVLFAYKGKQTKVVIPKRINYISTYAFFYNYHIRSIVIPDGVISIAHEAFYQCDHLSSVTIRSADKNYTVNLKSIPDVCENLAEAIMIILKKDYYLKCNVRVKYPILIDCLTFFDDENAKTYIKKSFTKIIKQLIDNDDVERITAVIKNSDFITAKNIDKLIDYAIEHTQNGGSTEPQIVLMHYKNEHIGFNDKLNKLML